LYSIDFWQFLKVAHLPVDKLGEEPIPLASPPQSSTTNLPGFPLEASEEPLSGPFFRRLLEQFEEIPFFLRKALPVFSGLHTISLRDVFWTERAASDFYPPLKDVQFVIVNRRTKTPTLHKWAPLWKQPLYLLMRRDGSYFCGRFSLEDGKVILQPPSDETAGTQRTSAADAEIVGQVVAVVRRISP
jgi:hypothetical protein